MRGETGKLKGEEMAEGGNWKAEKVKEMAEGEN